MKDLRDVKDLPAPSMVLPPIAVLLGAIMLL